jgi:hypothetical protein
MAIDLPFRRRAVRTLTNDMVATCFATSTKFASTWVNQSMASIRALIVI